MVYKWVIPLVKAKDLEKAMTVYWDIDAPFARVKRVPIPKGMVVQPQSPFSINSLLI